jgi:hypothetical protein
MKARGLTALLLGSAQAISISIHSPRQVEPVYSNVMNNTDLLIIFVYYAIITTL